MGDLQKFYTDTIEQHGVPTYVGPAIIFLLAIFIVIKVIETVGRVRKERKAEEERERFLRTVADRRRRSTDALDPADRRLGGVDTRVELTDAEKELRAKLLRDTMGQVREESSSQFGLPEIEKKRAAEAAERKLSELVKKAEIVCGEGAHAYKVVLTAKSLSVFEEAAKNPSVAGRTGEEFIRAIAETGGILDVERFRNGKLNDTLDGEPAFQSFNDEGTLVCITRYKDGKRNDSPDGEPAHQSFNREGRLVRVTRYRDDKLNDSPTGDPAFQSFDDDGNLVWVIRYKDDRQLKVLSVSEIAEYLESLNIAKGIESAIPGLKIH